MTRPPEDPITARRPSYGSVLDGMDRAEIARRYGRLAAYQEEAQEGGAFWLRLAALLLVLSALAMLGAFTLAQVTTRDSARRILIHAIPDITDFDHSFDAHYTELVSAASAPGAVNGVSLPTYPIKVDLKPSEILNHSPAEVRQTLLTRASDSVYDHGIGAFSPNGKPVKLGSATLFSAPWSFKTALSLLNPSFHRRLISVAKVSLGAVLVLSALVFLLSRDYNRIVLYSMALLLAAIPGLLAAGLAWLLVQVFFGSSSDPLISGTSDLARDVAWFGVLSYLVYAGLAVALFILGMLAERITDIVISLRDPARRGGRSSRSTA
jgi:hypothetical protein